MVSPRHHFDIIHLEHVRWLIFLCCSVFSPKLASTWHDYPCSVGSDLLATDPEIWIRRSAGVDLSFCIVRSMQGWSDQNIQYTRSIGQLEPSLSLEKLGQAGISDRVIIVIMKIRHQEQIADADHVFVLVFQYCAI